MEFEFESLLHLLGKRADDHGVKALIKCEPNQIVRLAHEGYVEFKDKGLSVMFKEAPWVLPPVEVSDPKALHLDAFHFHREGHDGYSNYSGQMPGGVSFGDTKEEISCKLGQPVTTGGGGFSTVLKKPIPHWIRYAFGTAGLHFQLDLNGRLEMVTLFIPDYEWVKD